jgi:hypothetical protein
MPECRAQNDNDTFGASRLPPWISMFPIAGLRPDDAELPPTRAARRGYHRLGWANSGWAFSSSSRSGLAADPS